MIKLENFDNASLSGITYGGHSGNKKGIIYNGEKWFLKYPKSTRSMEALYFKSLEYKYNNILKPVYEKLKDCS